MMPSTKAESVHFVTLASAQARLDCRRAHSGRFAQLARVFTRGTTACTAHFSRATKDNGMSNTVRGAQLRSESYITIISGLAINGCIVYPPLPPSTQSLMAQISSHNHLNSSPSRQTKQSQLAHPKSTPNEAPFAILHVRPRITNRICQPAC